MSKKNTPSSAFHVALNMVEAFGRDDLVLVPREPDDAMIKAGAEIGKITPQTARMVYGAMISTTIH